MSTVFCIKLIFIIWVCIINVVASSLASVQMDKEAVKDFFFVYGALALLLEV